MCASAEKELPFYPKKNRAGLSGQRGFFMKMTSV